MSKSNTEGLFLSKLLYALRGKAIFVFLNILLLQSSLVAEASAKFIRFPRSQIPVLKEDLAKFESIAMQPLTTTELVTKIHNTFPDLRIFIGEPLKDTVYGKELERIVFESSRLSNAEKKLLKLNYHSLQFGEGVFLGVGFKFPSSSRGTITFRKPTILLAANTSRMVIIHETLHYLVHQGLRLENPGISDCSVARHSIEKACTSFNLADDCSKFEPEGSEYDIALALWGPEAEHYDISLYIEKNAQNFRLSNAEIGRNVELKKIYEDESAWILAYTDRYMVEGLIFELSLPEKLVEKLSSEIALRLDALN